VSSFGENAVTLKEIARGSLKVELLESEDRRLRGWRIQALKTQAKHPVRWSPKGFMIQGEFFRSRLVSSHNDEDFGRLQHRIREGRCIGIFGVMLIGADEESARAQALQKLQKGHLQLEPRKGF
jgi:hypothetical protein